MNNRFKVLGINDDRDFCEICGKVELKKVVWLEDKESIQAKLNVMKQNNIAGVAEWKLGLEDPTVWDEIAAYTSGQ